MWAGVGAGVCVCAPAVWLNRHSGEFIIIVIFDCVRPSGFICLASVQLRSELALMQSDILPNCKTPAALGVVCVGCFGWLADGSDGSPTLA